MKTAKISAGAFRKTKPFLNVKKKRKLFILTPYFSKFYEKINIQEEGTTQPFIPHILAGHEKLDTETVIITE